jgi:hypothetical protein
MIDRIRRFCIGPWSDFCIIPLGDERYGELRRRTGTAPIAGQVVHLLSVVHNLGDPVEASLDPAVRPALPSGSMEARRARATRLAVGGAGVGVTPIGRGIRRLVNGDRIAVADC